MGNVVNKKIICWTHYDLDGVISYLVLRWTLGKKIPYKTSTPRKFREDFTKWLVNHNISDYDQIFITDLDVGEHKDLIDKSNVFIIDHHETHEKNMDYKQAVSIIKKYKSAAELAYKAFKKLYNIKLSDAQKKLIILASDYDSYTLQIPESKKLDCVFWNTNKSFDSFIRNFSKGFYGFSLEQENIIKLHEQKIKRIKDSMNVFYGKIKIQNQEQKVYATFANYNDNEISDILLNDFNADIAIVVNSKSNHISFRRPKNNKTNINLSILAEKLTNGGGHEYASGGELTNKFLEFTKLLQQIK